MPLDRAPAVVDLKIAVALGIASGVAVIALIPYLMQLIPSLEARLPVSVPVFAAAQAAQAAVLCTGLAWLGLRMGHRVGLGAPLLQRWVSGVIDPHAPPARPLTACVAGVLVALAILVLAQLIDPWLPPYRNVPAAIDPLTAARNGFAASFYGGIVEELQLRLFLVTLVVWLVTRRGRKTPSTRVYIGAIVLAAVAFGIAHLPAAANVWPLDAIVVLRIVLLNGVAGVVFGCLFWRHGLEMAILAHFCADLVLHVAVPLAGLPMR